MAATFTKVHYSKNQAGLVTVLGYITFSGNYATGGVAVDFTTYVDDDADVFVTFGGISTGYVPAWDRTNSKCLVFEAGADGDALDEIPTNGHALVYDCVVQGKEKL